MAVYGHRIVSRPASAFDLARMRRPPSSKSPVHTHTVQNDQSVFGNAPRRSHR